MLAVWWTCEIRVRLRVMRHGRLGTINWADRLAILTLDACHVQKPLHWQNEKAGAQSYSHIFAIDGIPLQPSDPVSDNCFCSDMRWAFWLIHWVSVPSELKIGEMV